MSTGYMNQVFHQRRLLYKGNVSIIYKWCKIETEKNHAIVLILISPEDYHWISNRCLLLGLL
jgi:hypothetical protein